MGKCSSLSHEPIRFRHRLAKYCDATSCQVDYWIYIVRKQSYTSQITIREKETSIHYSRHQETLAC